MLLMPLSSRPTITMAIVPGATVAIAARDAAIEAESSATDSAAAAAASAASAAASAIEAAGSVTGVASWNGMFGAVTYTPAWGTITGKPTTLSGYGITDAQPLNADLTAIGGLAKTDGNFIVGNGTTWVAESGNTAKTSLGVGTGDSPQFAGVNVGHASDTTLTRVSAGIVAVEGHNLIRANDVATASAAGIVELATDAETITGTDTGRGVTPANLTAKTYKDFATGVIETASNTDFRLILDLPFPITITEVVTRSRSGTCTATFKINSTALGGTANSVSTTENKQAQASANVASMGDDIVCTISANSTCIGMVWTIKYTRALGN